MSALVTILLPARRPHGGYFEEAIQSILSQTSPDWLACLITEEDDPFFQGYKSPDPRIRHIHTEGKGLPGSLNTGMKYATTRFVTSLFADDLLNPITIETLERHIRENPEIDCFHSSLHLIDGDGRFLRIRPSRPAVTRDDFVAHAVTLLMCWDVAKGLEAGGVDERVGLHASDDYDFPWTLWEKGVRFMNIPEDLYWGRIHQNHYRLTTHVPRHVQAETLRTIYRKHGLSETEVEAQVKIREQGYISEAFYP